MMLQVERHDVRQHSGWFVARERKNALSAVFKLCLDFLEGVELASGDEDLKGYKANSSVSGRRHSVLKKNLRQVLTSAASFPESH